MKTFKTVFSTIRLRRGVLPQALLGILFRGVSLETTLGMGQEMSDSVVESWLKEMLVAGANVVQRQFGKTVRGKISLLLEERAADGADPEQSSEPHSVDEEDRVRQPLDANEGR